MLRGATSNFTSTSSGTKLGFHTNTQNALFTLNALSTILLAISILLHSKPALIASKVIFTSCPADPWGKVRILDHNARKQKGRILSLASAHVRGGEDYVTWPNKIKPRLCSALLEGTLDMAQNSRTSLIFTPH